MMRKILLLLLSLTVFLTGYSQENIKQKSNSKEVALKTVKPDKKTKALRKKHAKFLANSPFKKTLDLSKKDRKAMGIPPNKYYESEWELTINPETGRPNPENIIKLRQQLEKERKEILASGRVPGDATDNNWIERGPTNVGGRTRGIMFDPNDAAKEIVFAGGVSGGLWKNTNITNANSVWTRVNIPENLAVSCITYDPNNPTTFYVGTGESYVGGDVNGDGVWKSTDRGVTWTRVLGGISGPTNFQSASNVTINSPAGIAGNYVCYPTTAFGTPIASQITANIVLVNDGTATPTLGCNPPTNSAALSGKIALIRRGVCPFVDKVRYAQNAGAIAVIMMNHLEGQPVPMGGTDATITIPSVMISKAHGDILEAALASGVVNGTLNPTTPNQITGNLVPGIQHINDIAIRNNGGVSEIYVAAGDGLYQTSGAFLGTDAYGLYKSSNGGSTWSQVSLPLTADNNRHCPNDIEIAADNKIWLSTTKTFAYGDGGGKIFSSTDGTTFTQRHVITDGLRTQIAVSSTEADKVYVLAQLNNATTPVAMLSTTNGFTSTTTMALPDDADNGIDANDFTRGQAFYDLMLEVDPTNDNIIYAGGIDLFRSTNAGSSWGQISKWSNNPGLDALSCSLVHADQHAMTFRPGNANQALFGTDGGVYFASNLSTAQTSSVISSRNTGLNVTQFYSLGVAPVAPVTTGLSGDYFVAGAQDNGSQYFAGVAAGTNSSVEAQGGDGAYSMFDQGNDKYYITNYVYNCNITYRPISGTPRQIDNDSNSDSNGQFICPMALDSSLDILYSDYSTSTPTYQIRRYTNLKAFVVGRTNLTDALLTSAPSALTVSKYTTASSKLLAGLRNGKLLRITNANTTPIWADITGPGFIGSISDVEFGQSENEILVTFHNYNVTSIWYSADAGVTWQNKEGDFPDIPVKCILQNPLNTNEVMIGTELGVWYTNNFNTSSPNWKQAYNGMRNVKVTDMDLRNDNVVFAATYGRGIFSGQLTSTTLSRNENSELSNSIKVYPTISNGNITIASEKTYGKTNLELFDINGKNVYSGSMNLDNNSQQINLGNLSSGNYILKLSGDGFETAKKLIIE